MPNIIGWTFVLPYAYSIQALAKAGLRDYLEAQELLDEAEHERS